LIFLAQDIKDIKEDSVFDDEYDREKWRGYVMAVIALSGLTSWWRIKRGRILVINIYSIIYLLPTLVLNLQCINNRTKTEEL